MIEKNKMDALPSDRKKIKVELTDLDFETKTTILEESKEFLWVRLYLNDEISDIKNGDMIRMSYENEYMDMQFASYNKKGQHRDGDDELVFFTNDYDKKVLVLMADIKYINNSTDIPFIRTLFKSSRHFEYQLLKRDELLFTNLRTNEMLKYFDVDL